MDINVEVGLRRIFVVLWMAWALFAMVWIVLAPFHLGWIVNLLFVLVVGGVLPLPFYVLVGWAGRGFHQPR